MKKLFLAITLLITGALFWLYSHKPNYSGQINLKGLSSPVEVYRDSNGVPHIYGKSERDTQIALGYVMAQDRLFQMETLRRIVNGQLSEVLGKDALKHDILLRKLMLRRSMDEFLDKNLKTMDPYIIDMANAFLEGVNLYLENGKLPLEFKLLGFKPKKFQLAEVLGVSGYLTLSFAEGLIADPLISDLSNTFSKEKMNELFIQHLGDKNHATKNIKTSFLKKSWYKDLITSIDFFEDRLGLFHGSNSWVLSGKRSQSNYPILANDPHVAFSNPGVWYEAHLHSPEHEIYGHYVPSVPFPAMGHNKDRGWAVTMAEMDDLDYYQEKINWDKKEVMFKGGWTKLIEHKEIIRIKDQKEYQFTLYRTPHGPLIDGTEFASEGSNLSIKWSYHHPQNDVATAIFKMGHAKSIEDYKKAVAYGATPGLNISWADKNGDIGWHVMSKVPIRPKGVSGRQILDGASGDHEYIGYLDIKENPHKYNPESGVIITANYHPEWTIVPVEGYWQPSDRFEYIHHLLSKKEKWTLEEMKVIQSNQHVQIGKWTINELLNDFNPETNLEKEAFNVLKSWDGESSKESLGSTIWHQWQKEVIRGILLDELGEERLGTYNRTADAWHFFKNVLKNESSSFWDNIHTPEKESKKFILEKAFKISLKKLEKKIGPELSKWNWGKLHTVEYKHVFGTKKPLDKIFNLGPYPAGGGASQIDNMSTKRNLDNFLVTLGPSVRKLIDFSNPSQSFGVLPTGNSGNLLSPFYKDQVEMFLDGGYRKQLLDKKEIIKDSKYLLKLNP